MVARWERWKGKRWGAGERGDREERQGVHGGTDGEWTPQPSQNRTHEHPMTSSFRPSEAWRSAGRKGTKGRVNGADKWRCIQVLLNLWARAYWFCPLIVGTRRLIDSEGYASLALSASTRTTSYIFGWGPVDIFTLTIEACSLWILSHHFIPQWRDNPSYWGGVGAGGARERRELERRRAALFKPYRSWSSKPVKPSEMLINPFHQNKMSAL